MQAAISTVTYMHHTLEQALDQAAAAGYRDLELLMIPGWIHAEPVKLPARALRSKLARRSLVLIGIHGGGIDGNDDHALARSLDYLSGLIPYAQAAGAGFVNVNGMPVPAGTAKRERERMLERIIGALGVLAPIAQANGVAIILENHANCHLETADDYARVLGAFPGASWLGATVDTGHCSASGVDAAALIARLGPRLKHLHIKDHAHGRSVGLGQGGIDNARAVQAAYTHGFRGHLSAELELADADSEREEARRALPYLRQLIDRITGTSEADAARSSARAGAAS